MGLDDDDPLKIYVRELATVQPLTKEEEDHLFQEVGKRGKGEEDATRRLLESKLILVLPIAERYLSSGLSMLDLIQEGNLGLMRAVHDFPDTRLDDFSAYAAACIENAISDAIAKSRSK